MPAPFRPVAGGQPMADEGPENGPAATPGPTQELEPGPEPAPESDSDSGLPTMTDLRSVATDLDDIDEILARLDDDESAPDDEPNQGGTDPVAEDDPEDQDPLLATR